MALKCYRLYSPHNAAIAFIIKMLKGFKIVFYWRANWIYGNSRRLPFSSAYSPLPSNWPPDSSLCGEQAPYDIPQSPLALPAQRSQAWLATERKSDEVKFKFWNDHFHPTPSFCCSAVEPRITEQVYYSNYCYIVFVFFQEKKRCMLGVIWSESLEVYLMLPSKSKLTHKSDKFGVTAKLNI